MSTAPNPYQEPCMACELHDKPWRKGCMACWSNYMKLYRKANKAKTTYKRTPEQKAARKRKEFLKKKDRAVVNYYKGIIKWNDYIETLGMYAYEFIDEAKKEYIFNRKPFDH